MGNHKTFLEIGSEIMFCGKKNCKGIRKDINNGVIPRVFILTSLNGENKLETNEKAKIGIFGINPGKHLPFENLYYKEVIKRNSHLNDVNKKIFKEIHATWVSEIFNGNDEEKLPYLKYFVNTKRFLSQIDDLLNLNEDDLILWGEIVYCEREDKRKLPKETILACTKEYLSQLFEFIKSKIIICLGTESYDVMVDFLAKEKITEKVNNVKVLGIYHPSGSTMFYKYFDDDVDVEERKTTNRKLRDDAENEIKQFLRNEEQFGFLKYNKDKDKVYIET